MPLAVGRPRWLAGQSAAVLGRPKRSNGCLASGTNYNSVLRYQLLLAIGLAKRP